MRLTCGFRLRPMNRYVAVANSPTPMTKVSSPITLREGGGVGPVEAFTTVGVGVVGETSGGLLVGAPGILTTGSGGGGAGCATVGAGGGIGGGSDAAGMVGVGSGFGMFGGAAGGSGFSGFAMAGAAGGGWGVCNAGSGSVAFVGVAACWGSTFGGRFVGVCCTSSGFGVFRPMRIRGLPMGAGGGLVGA